MYLYHIHHILEQSDTLMILVHQQMLESSGPVGELAPFHFAWTTGSRQFHHTPHLKENIIIEL